MSPEEVREALKHKCGTCDAPAGCECLSIIDGRPLREGPRGAVVHHYRKDTK